MKFRKEIAHMIRTGQDFRVVDAAGAVLVNFTRSGALIKRIAYHEAVANRLYVDSRPAELIAEELASDLERAGLRKRELAVVPWQGLRLAPNPAVAAVPPAEERRYYEAMLDYCRDRLARLDHPASQGLGVPGT
jgi:hypothetical protein